MTIENPEGRPPGTRPTFTTEEIALALALVRSPGEAAEFAEQVSGAGGDDASIGVGLTFDTLALLQIAAEELLRKVQIFSTGPHRSDVDAQVRRIRRELRRAGRIE